MGQFVKALFFFIFFLIKTTFQLSAQTVPDRPNILWIVSEDNSKHYLRLYEEGGAAMPNIEALAAEGITFENAFSNAPVCSVARSTIITGSYAPRIGAQYHRKMELLAMPDGLQMFPAYLREAGYYTSNNAKQDYNLVMSEGTWDESSRDATYKNRAEGQPFFHVQNFGGSHEGRLHFKAEEITENQTEHSLDSPLFPIYPDTETFRYTNAYYRDLHTKVDRQIGDFINELKDDGLLENTIIFYYGDHGGVLPGSKGYLYERGLNVPLVVYVPEMWKELSPFEKGSKSEVFIEFVDLAPTVLSLAGIKNLPNMDGSPFLGDSTSDFLENKNTAFGYADRFDEKYDLVRSLRKGDYKYIRNFQAFNIDALYNFYRYKMKAYREWEELYRAGKLNDIESQFFLPRKAEGLYKISEDPHEVENLSTIPEYRDILIDMRNELQVRLKEMPDLSFFPEPVFLLEGGQNPVAFGQKHKQRIAELLDIADLQLLQFESAKSAIAEGLSSPDPWKRYWSLIVCSYFNTKAAEFFGEARRIMLEDVEGLNRMRAIEFLILSGEEVEASTILEVLKNSKTEAECNLMLNTIALIKFTKEDFKIKIAKDLFNPDWLAKENDLVSRRLNYINGK